MALLSVQNVSKTFKDHDYRVHAVRNASLEVHRGEMIAIMGPSGSGKTTLLNLMGIVVAPDSGEVYVDGQKASDMRPCDAGYATNTSDTSCRTSP